MTQHADVAIGRDIVARWCNLAEQRLEYLSTLFETGRWRRYHGEVAFLENIQEAKAAVETWRRLLTGEPSPGPAIDFGSPTNGISQLAHHAGVHDEPVLQAEPEPTPILVETLREIPDGVLAALESQLIVFDAPATEEPDLHDAEMPPLDLEVMQQRYPLLRNAL